MLINYFYIKESKCESLANCKSPGLLFPIFKPNWNYDVWNDWKLQYVRQSSKPSNQSIPTRASTSSIIQKYFLIKLLI